MVKHISTKWRTSISAKMTLYKDDDSVKITNIDVDDIINIRCIENNTLKSYTGRVSNIDVNIVKNSVSAGNTNNPVDTSSSDIKVINITLDCSKQYASKIVSVDVRDIVESDIDTNVTKIVISPNIKASFTVVSKSDSGEESEVTVNNVVVGSIISPFEFKDTKGDIKNITATVSKFLYEERPEGNIIISGMIVKDENGKVYSVKFKDILSLNQEEPINPENPEEQNGEITPPSGPTNEDDF